MELLSGSIIVYVAMYVHTNTRYSPGLGQVKKKSDTRKCT